MSNPMSAYSAPFPPNIPDPFAPINPPVFPAPSEVHVHYHNGQADMSPVTERIDQLTQSVDRLVKLVESLLERLEPKEQE